MSSEAITRNDLTAILNEVLPSSAQKTESLLRPLSTNQQSDWSYTAPADGVLYLDFVVTTRTYITVTWNGANIAHFAGAPTSPNAIYPYPILMRKDDTVRLEGLSSNCYLLASTTCFITNAYH